VIPLSSLHSNHSSFGFELPNLHHPASESSENSEVSSKNKHTFIVSPEQVGAKVLLHLKQITAKYLGHTQVNKAVIAVPAKFNAQQRAATAEAYKLAGLKVIRVIEEPTAAAVAYKLHKSETVKHILVYDFGGGTLDVSLLYVSKGAVQVYATEGDELLGGSDLDVCLVQHLRHLLADQLTTTCSQIDLIQQAESIKKQLTYQDSAAFTCDHPSSTSTSSSLAHNTVTNPMKIVITRSDFETVCADLFDRALLPVKRLLEELNMDREDVDEVVLVGGSTRIPKVKAMLREYFNKEKLNDYIDPDITVAYGAASILQ
jgi:molecular chaperone DnaK (HSP70)